LSSRLPPFRPPSPFTPFLRRFTDERARDLAATSALYRDVQAAHKASIYAHDDIIDVASRVIAERVGEAVELPNSVALGHALDACQQEVLSLETALFTFPNIDWRTAVLSLKEQVDLNRFLRAKQHFLGNHERVIDELVNTLTVVFASLIEALPPGEKDGGAAFTVPLSSLLGDPGLVIARITGFVCASELTEVGLFTTLRARLYENVCRASGVDPDDEKPRKPLITADRSELPPHELVETYLHGTPFVDLFSAPVPFSLPDESRFEHMQIVAGSGHGKTQLLQHLIAHDLERADSPSLIVIDSQGEMLRKIQRLAIFGGNSDRLIIIDPEQYSPALNMFDTTNGRASRYSELHREQLQAGIVELYNYIFASIAAEMTSRQSTAFAFVSRLLLTIPGATIHTLRELMEDPAPSIERSRFRSFIEKLEPTARSYFQNQFFTRRYGDLKQAIARRLYGVLSVPAFDRMFSARENRVDMFEAMQSGKIVLVNTSKALLKTDASALFGRYMIALVIRAVYERVATAKRHPTYLIVDEASEYFDDNIQALLEQARKYNVGLVLAHQHLDQLSTSLRSAIAANTAIKLSGGVNDRDARALAPDMRTTAEFISAMRKRRTSTEFACYIRNNTDSALRLAVPFGTLEAEPCMSADEESELVQLNSGRYRARPVPAAAGEVTVPPSQEVVVPPPVAEATTPSSAPAEVVVPVASVEVATPPTEEVSQQSATMIETPAPASRPVPPRKARAAVSPPPALGRGGKEHKYLQNLIKEFAISKGYHAVIEEQIVDGAGSVDVSLTREGLKIACEISVTTGRDHELGNLQKCLAAGYGHVLFVSRDARHVKAMEKLAAAELVEAERAKIYFVDPESGLGLLEGWAKADVATTVRGYKVRTTTATIDSDDAVRRRSAVASVIAKSLRKKAD
jgi:hypothetical protein